MTKRRCSRPYAALAAAAVLTGCTGASYSNAGPPIVLNRRAVQTQARPALAHPIPAIVAPSASPEPQVSPAPQASRTLPASASCTATPAADRLAASCAAPILSSEEKERLFQRFHDAQGSRASAGVTN